jgi:hypothetical protein
VARRRIRSIFLIKELFAPARVFFATPLFLFGPELSFDLRPNPCFEIDPLTLFSRLSRTLRFLSTKLRLGLGLTARFFLRLETGGFFRLPASFGFDPSLRFLFGTTSGLFSCQPLCFFFCAPAGFFLGAASRFFFFTAASHGFSPQLSLNLGAQPRFFFRLQARAKLRLPSHFFVYATTFGLLD